MSANSKKAWFAASLAISTAFAFAAYKKPEKILPMSDFLATIIAILIGVSLAISAVLATPPKVIFWRQCNKRSQRTGAKGFGQKLYCDVKWTEMFVLGLLHIFDAGSLFEVCRYLLWRRNQSSFL